MTYLTALAIAAVCLWAASDALGRFLTAWRQRLNQLDLSIPWITLATSVALNAGLAVLVIHQLVRP